MSVVFFGSREFGAAVLDYLIKHNLVQLAVVPYKVREWERPVTELAIQNNIPLVYHQKAQEKRLATLLAGIGPKLCVMCCYDYTIPKEIIKIPKKGFVNIHPGKLPEYRGPTPIDWQMKNESFLTVTLHFVDEKLDAGPIIDMMHIKPVPLAIMPVVKEFCIRILENNLDKLLRGQVTAIPQDESKAKYWPKYKEMED